MSIRTWDRPHWKTSRTASKRAKLKIKAKRVKHERDEKGKARKRDGYRCRFPLCGCKALGLKLDALPEVSHDRHKGMGGNPAGDRSTSAGLITLCRHRHQDGATSRHKGTLRSRPLTSAGNDGPVAWEIREPGVQNERGWLEVARELAPGRLGPLEHWQRAILERLSDMDD